MNGTPDLLPEAPNLLDITEAKCVTGYQVRKGLSDHWYRDGNTAIEGCPVYRAAEAYLNYIEADCMDHLSAQKQPVTGEISVKEPGCREIMQ